MATSGSVSTNAYTTASGQTRYVRVDWTQTSSGNVSTITYNVYADGTYTGSMSMRNILLEISTGGVGTASVDSIQVYKDHSAYVSNGLLDTGSFTITHNSSANANLTITVKASIYEWNYNKSGSGSWSLPTLTTACSAPTGIYLSVPDPDAAGGFVAPGASVTFITGFWPGSNGNNNPISKYRLYYNFGDYPNSSSSYLDLTITTESNGSKKAIFSIPIATTQRGKRVRIAIQSIGTVSGFNSGLQNCNGYYLVNNLPSAPTGTISAIVPSSATSCHLSVNAGSDSDGQMTKVYYLNGSTYQEYTSSTSLAITSSTQTFSFKTFDGLEFSTDKLDVTVTRNTKPVITTFSISNATVATSKVSGFSGAYATNLSLSAQASKTSGRFALYLYYTGSYTSSPTSYQYSTLLTTFSGGSFTNYNVNILQLIGYDKSYKLVLKYNDDIEDADDKEISTYNSKNLSLAPWPTFIAKYNQFANSNIAGTKEGEFWNKVRFVYTYDSTFTNSQVSSQVSGYSTSTTLRSDSDYLYLDVTVNGTLDEGTYTFTNTFYDATQYYSNASTISMKECPIPFLSSVSFSAQQVNVMSGDPSNPITLSVWVNKFWADSNLSNYSIDLNTNSTTLNFVINGVSYSAEGKYNIETSVTGKDDVFALTVAPQNFYPILNSLFIDGQEVNGRYNAQCIVTIKNRYGREFSTSTSPTIIMNFNSAPSITFARANVKYYDGNNYNEVGTASLIEGLGLVFTPTVTGYNTSKIDYTVEVSRDNKITWNTFLNGSLTKQDSQQFGYNQPYAYSNDNKVQPIGEITSSNDCYFRIVLNDGINSSVTALLDETFARTEHTLATIEMTSIDYSEGKYTIGYSCSDLGCATPSSGSVIFQKDTSNLSSTTTGIDWNVTNWTTFLSDKTKELSSTMTADFEFSRIKVTTTISKTYGTYTITNTKTAYSNTILVYNVSPTASLRKNHIGINKKDIESFVDGVIIIGATSGRNKIYFSGSQKPSISEAPYIDIENYEIDGFIIDGGTW